MNNIYIYNNTITSFSIYSNLGNSCCWPSGATTPRTRRPSTLSSASSCQTTHGKPNAEAMPSLNTNLQRIHLAILQQSLVFLFVVTITEWLTPRCTGVVFLPISAMAYCNKSIPALRLAQQLYYKVACLRIQIPRWRMSIPQQISIWRTAHDVRLQGHGPWWKRARGGIVDAAASSSVHSEELEEHALPLLYAQICLTSDDFTANE